MTNFYEIVRSIVISSVCVAIIIGVVSQVSYARQLKADIYDQWNSLEQYERVDSLRDFLIAKDWIYDGVIVNDLDYILVLVNQCSNEFFPELPTSLVLAIISMESSFQKDLVGFSNDTGLMQIIPKYHRDRIDRYIYDENVDLYDPRLNVMVGMDYLSELMDWANRDSMLAVMAYNMGPTKAADLYFNGHCSSYAETVLERADLIEEFLERR